MLKYVDTKEVFAEIPDEITLAISISGCPIRCKGCHSKYLWDDVGEPLSVSSLSAMLADHAGISCVCFMGGDQSPQEINTLARWVKENTDVRTAWYSGADEISPAIELGCLDYLKTGHYSEKSGPLNSPTTNQILWRIEHKESENNLVNITSRFWK
ncbi:MAG: 4Fe-4S cluster-binding domain-containing protein [Bacteroidaceae bacterium]|nr:4Fe-4S cluster-binding domain-containing protein [Bacteroidaceae bacterium]